MESVYAEEREKEGKYEKTYGFLVVKCMRAAVFT